MGSRELFQLIDLDRTLFDTSLYVKLICDVVDEYEPGLGDEIDRRFEESYHKEETFFALEYIRERLGKERYEQMLEVAVARAGTEGLLLAGAKDRLAFAKTLAGDEQGYGLLTYSENPADQLKKVQLVGLDHLPMYVGDTPDKARLIASWRTTDGKYQLPKEFGNQLVDRLTLEDDKLRAFVGLPENVKGIWLTTYDDAVERMRAANVKNVTIAKDLYESMQALSSE